MECLRVSKGCCFPAGLPLFYGARNPYEVIMSQVIIYQGKINEKLTQKLQVTLSFVEESEAKSNEELP
jgi:hypothetical protein